VDELHLPGDLNATVGAVRTRRSRSNTSIMPEH
jgi:hypothetical protein